MKPTKNRYYCVAIDRIKMLFESESKANNFMKFNAETIEKENGYKPVRAYYCASCIGWHLTSIPLTKPSTNSTIISFVKKKNIQKYQPLKNQNLEIKKQSKEIVKDLFTPTNDLFEKEPSIRLSKICKEFNIGLKELFNLFKNHNIHINLNPNYKVNLTDFEEIKYRLV